MPKTATHFEQVPLETVRKLVEEQNHGEAATEGNRETKQEKSEVRLMRADAVNKGGGQS